jgi:hypothetical protein
MSVVARTTSRSSSPGSRGSRLGRSHPGVRRCEAVREYPVDPATASALYSLGRLQADPASGFPSYRAAQAAFSRLLTDFPKSRWEADARAWRATLDDLLAREEEATRLKVQLQWREEQTAHLKLQLREQEALGLKAQFQQLGRVDLRPRTATVTAK